MTGPIRSRPSLVRPTATRTTATETTTTTTATQNTNNVFERANTSSPPLKAKPIAKATIVGAGPAGLAQASLLVKRAKEIGLTELTIVELRSSYTRPVGLALRQMSLDALAWLNPHAHKALGIRSLNHVQKRVGEVL